MGRKANTAGGGEEDVLRRGAGFGRSDAREPPDVPRTRAEGEACGGPLLERLRREIVAIERRGMSGGADDPQARRWLERARRMRASEEDPDADPDARRGVLHGHSFQERIRAGRVEPSVADEALRPSASEASVPFLRTGWPEIDAVLGGFPALGVHELFGLEPDTPPGRPVPAPEVSAWIPPVGVAMRIAAMAMGEEESNRPPGSEPRGVLWIGRAIWPDPEALLAADRSASREVSTVSRSLFLDLDDPPSPRGRRSTLRCGSRRAWAIEQALRHRAFAVIVADGRGLGVPECRRLEVAAAGDSPATPVLLLREMGELSHRSVASFRWRVEPCVDDAGRSAWRLRLVRGRLGRLSIDGGGAESGTSIWRRIESEEGLGAIVATGLEGERSIGSMWACAG